MKRKNNKGISLIEILIVIAIIGILSAIIVPSLSKFHNQQVLKNSAEDIFALLNEARNSTISSKNSNTYGVRFLSDRAILFPGEYYTDSTSNKQIDFDQAVEIPSTGGVNLNTGGIDVIFTRLTGDTEKYGTIIIQLISDETQQKIINVSKIGMISVN
ncbi:MAG: prepilin-type N-terminal cleavage/methylation domain-containing protein [Candidatus Paceibacterota bacterium]|jgi:prepilin-type N-terminal cleavage/methylation domain-containing protein